jgi:hypothetical protein
MCRLIVILGAHSVKCEDNSLLKFSAMYVVLLK